MKPFVCLALLALASPSPSSAPGLDPINESNYRSVIAAHKGKVVLVDFWATWCIPCRKELPALVKLEAKLAPKGLVLLTVSTDEADNKDNAEKFLRNTGVTSPGYIKLPKDDDAFIRMIDPTWSGEVPALLLYDKSGKRVRIWKGDTPMAELEAAIAKLL